MLPISCTSTFCCNVFDLKCGSPSLPYSFRMTLMSRTSSSTNTDICKPHVRVIFYEYPASTSPFRTGIYSPIISSRMELDDGFEYSQYQFNPKNSMRPFLAEARFDCDMRATSFCIEGESKNLEMFAFTAGDYACAITKNIDPDPSLYVESWSMAIGEGCRKFESLPDVPVRCIQIKCYACFYNEPAFTLMQSTTENLPPFLSDPTPPQPQPEKQECEELAVSNCNKFASLDLLPVEILIRIIFSIELNLRLKTILALSGVCRQLRNSLADQMVYSTVDLKPFAGRQISEELFYFLCPRFFGVRNLRMSRLPSNSIQCKETLCSLLNIPFCLTTFVAPGCRLVDDTVLGELCTSQPMIENLDISSCQSLTRKGFNSIVNLPNLKRLSVAFTCIEEPELFQIVTRCRKIEAVNFLSVRVNSKICEKLAALSHQIKAIRMRSRWVSGVVLMRALMQPSVHFDALEELHVPSTSSVGISIGSQVVIEPFFRTLAQSCPKLRSLIVGGVSKSDVEAFAANLSNLEMLAMSFSPSLDSACVRRLIAQCRKLKFLGVSGAAIINRQELNQLRRDFPNCRIET